MELLKKALTSRKWVSAICGALLPILNQKMGWGLDSETITLSIVSIASAIFGQAYVDGKAVEGTPPIAGS